MQGHHPLNLLDKLAAKDPVRHADIIAKNDALENGKAIFWKILGAAMSVWTSLGKTEDGFWSGICFSM